MKIKGDNSKKITEAKERKGLIISARTATGRAKRVSAALGLPIKTISNGTFVEKSANGKITAIKTIEKIKSNKPRIKKGTVLCLK